jgi:hypothetical protein
LGAQGVGALKKIIFFWGVNFDPHCIPIAWKGEIMGENLPSTSYLSQKEYRFIEKCNFCDDLKLLKKIVFGVQVQGVKTPALKKIWLEHRLVPVCEK